LTNSLKSVYLEVAVTGEILPRETQPNRRSPHLVGSHLSPRLLLSAAAPTPCLFPVAFFN
jgi:hypothetical protein